jgi:hypothetical protein
MRFAKLLMLQGMYQTLVIANLCLDVSWALLFAGDLAPHAVLWVWTLHPHLAICPNTFGKEVYHLL